MDFCKSCLVFCVAISIPFVGRAAVLNTAIYDADEYLFYGTYKSERDLLYVGQNDLTTGSPYQYHFNFAAVKFDLAGFSTGATSCLQLNLGRFRIPGPVDPNYQGQPAYTYATSGYSFDLKVVALGADFSAIYLLEVNDLPNWYLDHLWSRPTIGTMSFSSAESVSLDVSSAVDAWLANPTSNYGFGLVGSFGSAQGLTAQFYSSQYTTDPSKTPALIQSTPGLTENPLVSWMEQNGFSAQADLSQDLDGDGLSDLMEFFLNRDPRVADASNAFTCKIEGNQLVLLFTRRAGNNLGVSWDVRSSESLSYPIEGWSTVTISEGVEASGLVPCSAQVTISNTKPKQFMRLVLRQTP